MNAMKRLEISIESAGVTKILQVLELMGIADYDVISGVNGARVNRDPNMGLGFLRVVESRSIIIAYCSCERIDAVVDQLSALISNFDGRGYVSDVLEIGKSSTNMSDSSLYSSPSHQLVPC